MSFSIDWINKQLCKLGLTLIVVTSTHDRTHLWLTSKSVADEAFAGVVEWKGSWR